MSGQQPQPPQQAAPPAGPASTDPPAGPAATPDSLEQKIIGVFGKLLGNGNVKVTDKAPAGRQSTEEKTAGVAEQVRAAIDAIKAEDQQRVDEQARVTAVQTLRQDVDALKAAAEQQPLQVRKVERFMGWHLPDDKA